jgi:signal transduction histidine kinase
MYHQKQENTTGSKGASILYARHPEEVLFVTDPDLKITYMNPQAELLTGWNMIYAVNAPLDKVCQISEVIREVRESIKDPAFLAKETITRDLLSSNGSAASLILSLLRDRKGRKNGYLIILHQESGKEAPLLSQETEIQQEVVRLRAELKQKEQYFTEQIQEMEREMERFTYSVSHDLKAPLRVISGFSRILMEDFAIPLNAEGRQLLKDIGENVSRLESLIIDILTYSRVNTRKIELMEIDMVSLAHSVYHELVKEYGHKSIELHIGKMPRVNSDPFLVRQIWKNLMDNAIKFSFRKTNPVIEIGCIKEGRENLFFVKDNGEGFDMKYIHKVFNAFERLHPAEDFKGNGMGLAVVKRILDRLHGKIKAISTEKQGAAFFFTLEGTSE